MNLSLDVFFPPYCVFCKKDAKKGDRFESVCDECFLNIRELPPAFNVIKPLDRVIWYGSYGDPVLRALIDNFKYRGAKELAKPLAELQARALEESGVERLFYKEKPVVAFIPMHPLRERMRGYNHALLLAFSIGEHFSLPVVPLLKRSWLAPRHALIKDKKERRENSKGSFGLLTRAVPQKIILVDDVCTTGSSFKEAGRVLKRGGAEIIWGIAAAGARTKPRRSDKM